MLYFFSHLGYLNSSFLTFYYRRLDTFCVFLVVEKMSMESKDIEYFRQELNHQLDSILERGRETLDTMSEKSEFFADPADRATAESDRTFILRLRDRDRKVVKKIRQTLDRIDNGDFGVCEECGEEIGLARLKARPVATLCIRCKSAQEEEEKLYSKE